MKEIVSIKISVYLLAAIIPVLALGIYFSSNNESLFFVYEWLLLALIIFSLMFAIRSSVTIKSDRRWTALSIVVFLLQFSVLSLFLGPFSYFGMFYLYYAVVILAFVMYFLTLKKCKSQKSIPIVFIILTGLMALYMIFLNALWGNNLA